MAFLEMRDVHKRYGEHEVLRSLNLSVNEHQVVCLIGPSGCGKSTFLRSLNRMNDTIDGCRVTGKITLDSDDIYDPDIDAWRIQWTDPVTRNFLQMVGRAEGPDIVQLGTRPDGQLARWSFLEISAASFLWRGEVSADAGATWRIVTEFTARRRPA